MGVLCLKNSCNKFSTILAIIAVATALTAATAAILVFLEKKRRDDKELEHYLDCSIQ